VSVPVSAGIDPPLTNQASALALDQRVSLLIPDLYSSQTYLLGITGNGVRSEYRMGPSYLADGWSYALIAGRRRIQWDEEHPAVDSILRGYSVHAGIYIMPVHTAES
jgi:hypothetical protein